MKPATCYYRVLNVSARSTMPEIFEAFSRIPEQEKTPRMEEAFQVLSKEETRKIYDNLNGMANNLWIGDNDFTHLTLKSPAKMAKFQESQIAQREHMDEVIKAYDEYFQTKYFKNKDYFKRKIETGDDGFHLTKKLIKKVAEKEAVKADYVKFETHKGVWFVKREEMLDSMEPGYMRRKLTKEFRWAILLGLGLTLFFGGIKIAPEIEEMLKSSNKGV